MSEQKPILVVDDEPEIRELVKEILIDEGYTVEVAKDGESANQRLSQGEPLLVLLDVWMPDIDGTTLLRQWRDQGLLCFPVVMMSGHGTVETAVEATRLGAVDFIEKPLSLARMLLTIERALSEWQTRDTPPAAAAPPLPPLPELIGNSQYLRDVRLQIEQSANTNGNVLISGPNGSGKTLLAQHIHRQSDRQQAPLVVVRADALDDASAAVDWYGSEYQNRTNAGFLEQANGGVLLIHDVAELGDTAQRLLAAALATGKLVRVGGVSEVSIDVRVIATSAEELKALMQSKNLSEELYYRLAVLPLHTVALSEHREDIPQLLEYYVNWFHEHNQLAYRHFNVSAQNAVRNHPWHGDVRELRNFVQRMMALGSGVEVSAEDVQDALTQVSSPAVIDGEMMRIPLEMALREARAEFERAYLVRQLDAVNGRIGELSARVGMERTHLYRKLRSLGIDAKRAAD